MGQRRAPVPRLWFRGRNRRPYAESRQQNVDCHRESFDSGLLVPGPGFMGPVVNRLTADQRGPCGQIDTLRTVMPPLTDIVASRAHQSLVDLILVVAEDASKS